MCLIKCDESSVRPVGVEPTTYGFEVRHSIQLSYERVPRSIPDSPSQASHPADRRRAVSFSVGLGKGDWLQSAAAVPVPFPEANPGKVGESMGTGTGRVQPEPVPVDRLKVRMKQPWA